MRQEKGWPFFALVIGPALYFSQSLDSDIEAMTNETTDVLQIDHDTGTREHKQHPEL